MTLPPLIVLVLDAEVGSTKSKELLLRVVSRNLLICKAGVVVEEMRRAPRTSASIP